jgi:uncharacterized protein YbjT (DUF2867 family)
MMPVSAKDVLVTGGTGYVGRPLIQSLVEAGHRVRVLCRASSAARVPAPAVAVIGDALDPESIHSALRPGDTLVQLVGTPHPGPSKAAEFVRVDLTSVKASVEAAKRAGVAHFVYVSVAHPAPVMHAYIAVRTEGELAITEAGLTATILRPWYVLGPGHRWPIALIPIYAVASLVPAWRSGAQRLGLVTLKQMVTALTRAVANPPEQGFRRILEVPAIRDA